MALLSSRSHAPLCLSYSRIIAETRVGDLDECTQESLFPFSSVGVWLSNRPRHRTQWTPAVNTGLRSQHQRNSRTLNRQRAGSASAVLSLISDYIYAHTVCCASKQWHSVVRKVENVYLGNCSNRDRSCSLTKAVGKAEHKLSTQLLLFSVSMSDCVWSLCRCKYANKLLFYTQFMTRYILIMHSLQEDVTWAYGEPQH